MHRKAEWIGGLLADTSEGSRHETTIKDITLEPNGKDSAMFSIVGEDFACGSDVKYLALGVNRPVKPNVLDFKSSFGLSFEISPLAKAAS